MFFLICIYFSANEVVRSIFELRNNPNLETSRFYRQLIISEVQRHPFDSKSPEVKCMQQFVGENVLNVY